MPVNADELEFDVVCRGVDPPATSRRRVGRPSEGVRTESFVCETCGRTVTIKVVARSSALRLRTRAAVRMATLLAFTGAVLWSLWTRGVSVGGLLMAALAVVFVLASVPLLRRLFTPGFRLALDASIQGELEKAYSGTPVHVFSPPGATGT